MTLLAAALAALGLVLARAPVRHLPTLPSARAPERRAAGGARAPAESRSGAVLAGFGTAAGVALVAPGWLATAGIPAGVVVWDRVRRMEPRSLIRQREVVHRELPHVVDLLRALLRSGAAPDRALSSVIRVVSPQTRAELQPYLGRLELGGDPTQVWSELRGHPALGRLGATLHRATASGASVAVALERLADDLRAARRAEVAMRVRQVEVRTAAPLGACLLPAFVLIGVVPLVAGAMQSLAVA